MVRALGHIRSSGADGLTRRSVMAVYSAPGTDGSLVTFKPRYENFIGGEWVPPKDGNYFENITPVTGQVFTEIPSSTAEDVETALDAAWAAAPSWGRTSTTERRSEERRVGKECRAGRWRRR